MFCIRAHYRDWLILETVGCLAIFRAKNIAKVTAMCFQIHPDQWWIFLFFIITSLNTFSISLRGNFFSVSFLLIQSCDCSDATVSGFSSKFQIHYRVSAYETQVWSHQLLMLSSWVFNPWLSSVFPLLFYFSPFLLKSCSAHLFSSVCSALEGFSSVLLLGFDPVTLSLFFLWCQLSCFDLQLFSISRVCALKRL